MTTPPDVVRTRASSTVLVNASSRVKRDLGGMLRVGQWITWYCGCRYCRAPELTVETASIGD